MSKRKPTFSYSSFLFNYLIKFINKTTISLPYFKNPFSVTYAYSKFHYNFSWLSFKSLKLNEFALFIIKFIYLFWDFQSWQSICKKYLFFLVKHESRQESCSNMMEIYSTYFNHKLYTMNFKDYLLRFLFIFLVKLIRLWILELILFINTIVNGKLAFQWGLSKRYSVYLTLIFNYEWIGWV